MKDVYQKLVAETKNYFEKEGFGHAVIGMSGGVDSALCLRITVDAIGSKKVLALLMPERGLTKPENVEHAKAYCEELGVQYHIIYINDFIRQYIRSKWSTTKHALMNLKSRIRATLLYFFANMNQALVIGTSNRTEMELGYFTKYGDGAVDIELIGTLFKTEVWEMAKLVGVPDEIVTKKPSAELWDNHTDEEELGLTYREADQILKELENGSSDHPKAGRVKELMKATEHKRALPPVIQR